MYAVPLAAGAKGNRMLGFWTPSGLELVVILVIGLLLFGKRLPEVGRSMGRAIIEFKKGVKGVEDEISQSDARPADAARPSLNSAGESRRVSTSDTVEEKV